MTKAELIKKWQVVELTEHGNTHPAIRLEELISSLCGVMASELFEGGEVSLPGIGKLKSVRVAGRNRLIPRTGEKTFVPAHLKVIFRPSKMFKERLN